MTQNKGHKKRGSVLVVSLMATTVMLIIALPLITKVSVQLRGTEKSFKSMKALYLAEAGIERAIWEINYGDISGWDGDSDERTMTISPFLTSGGNDAGTVEITVINPSGEVRIIEAKGIVPFVGDLNLNKTVRVALDQSKESFFNYGIFGNSGIEIHGNAYTDSFNSDEDPYNPSDPGSKGKIGTNSTNASAIRLLNNVVVNGNVYSGPSSDPETVVSIENNAEVNGSLSVLEEAKQLPSVILPEGLPDYWDWKYPVEESDVTITESGKYKNFKIPSDKILRFSGGTVEDPLVIHVVYEMILDLNSQIIIEENSAVEFILEGNLKIDDYARFINLNLNPKALCILGADSFEDLEFVSNFQFYGTLYTPHACITLSSNADFFGSVVADYVNISSNSGIHFDEYLKDWDRHSILLDTFGVAAWQEKRSQ
ncbi:MAG: pilus assembly PilX N-terminal domain-containing protein [Candidatus Aminicenantaceae bacterium]